MKKLRDYLFIFIMIAIIVSAFMVFSPHNKPVPHRDSGIFLFIGSEILQGKVLYQQTWDNKQPLLYLLNAAGLWIGSGSTWGVWGLELALFIAALILMYCVLRKSLSPFASFSVSMASFLTIFQIMSGNFSEEYAVFFQIGILSMLFLVYLPNKHRFSRALSGCGIGVLTGLVFCLKQTYIDVAISVVLLIILLGWLEKDKKLFTHLLFIMGGFVLVNAALILYFYFHGALTDYIDSAYLFNTYYSQQGLIEWIQSVLEVFEFNATYPFLFIMDSLWLGSVLIILVKGWPVVKEVSQSKFAKWFFLLFGVLCLGLFSFAEIRSQSAGIGLLQGLVLVLGILAFAVSFVLFRNRHKAISGDSRKMDTLRQTYSEIDGRYLTAASFLFLGIIDLPIVILSISLSGMNFNHYYISLFTPSFLFLSAFVLFLVNHFEQKPQKLIVYCVLIAIFLAGSFTPLLQIITRVQVIGTQDSRSEAAAYLKSVTTSQDKILSWGWESGIYFLANRESPTRYSFQFLLYFNSPYKQKAQATLLKDIKTDPPLYIVDTIDPEMPFIDGKTNAECLADNPLDGNKLHAILNYVCSNYEYVKSFGDIKLYKRIQ